MRIIAFVGSPVEDNEKDVSQLLVHEVNLSCMLIVNIRLQYKDNL